MPGTPGHIRDAELIRKYALDHPQPSTAVDRLCRQAVNIFSALVLKTKMSRPLQLLDPAFSKVQNYRNNNHSHLAVTDNALQQF